MSSNTTGRNSDNANGMGHPDNQTGIGGNIGDHSNPRNMTTNHANIGNNTDHNHHGNMGEQLRRS